MNAQTPTKAAANLSGSLVRALAEIEGAAKDKVNPHFKSKYADIASVIDAIKPVLAKHDLGFTQHSQPSEAGVIVETVLHHAGGETLSMGSLYVPANKNDAQGFGSALTYARRYALMTAFGVPAEDDDGNAAASSTRPTTGEERPVKRSDEKPFTLGPAKNRTDLKTKGRDFWRDVEACPDASALDALIASSKPLIDQLKIELPTWWDGGQKDGGEPFEGLRDVIERRQADFVGIMSAIGAG